MAYIVSSGESSEGIILDNNSMTVHYGGTANSTTVNRNGYMDVDYGGIANSTTVNVSGWLTVYKGGQVNNTTVNIAGYLIVYGSADNTMLGSYGGIIVSSGGTATNITASEGANLRFTVTPDTYAQGTSAGSAFEIKKAYVSGYTFANGCLILENGGSALDTTVNSGGWIEVTSWGYANNTTVNEYGSVFVFSGGTADNTAVNEYGRFIVSSGGTADNTAVNEYGRFIVSSGGTANNTVVNEYGSVFVFSGGTADSITVNADGGIYVYSGGKVHDTTVDKGTLYLEGGGTADNTTVNADGEFNVGGGAADGATVGSEGRLVVFNGGTLTGRMTFENGAFVSAFDGAYLDFDLTQTTAEAEALVKGLSLIQGAMDYTLSVGGEQEECIYALAEDAAGFDGTITVVNKTTGNVLGTLGGVQKVRNGDWEYQLHLVESTLTLSVTAANLTAPTITDITADITAPTNRNVTVSAVFSDDVELAESLYRIGPDGEWTPYDNGVTVDQNTTVYFRAVDASGNETESFYEVTNIDRTPPATPVPAADVTEQTVGTVRVSASFSEDSVVREYSFDGETWYPYEEAVSFTKNGAIYFLGKDEAGNPSEIAEYGVTNIEPVLISGATVLPGESAVVIAGQTYQDAMVFSGGAFLVESGGTANTVLVENGGAVEVESGGSATGLELSEGAGLTLHVAPDTYAAGTSGGSAFDVMDAVSGWTLDAVRLYVHDGGTASDLTVNQGGYLYVSTGGTATEILENGGYLSCLNGMTNVSLIPNTLSGMVISGDATMHSGTSGIELTVNGGWLSVYSGTTAEGTTVSAGSLCIYGGTAANTVVSGGVLRIGKEGGTAADTVVMRGGRLDVSSGTATGVSLSDGGRINVYSGGTVDGVVVSSGASIYADRIGAALNSVTIEHGGSVYMKSGAVLSNLTISSGAVFNLSSGVSADRITVLSGGTLHVMNNAFAAHVDWDWMTGGLIVDSGGLVTYAGSCTGIYPGNGKSYTTMYDIEMQGETITIMPGGTMNGVQLRKGKLVLYGGAVYDAMVTGGTINVCGGTADTVFANGGVIIVAGDGVLRDFFVQNINNNNANTRISVSSGGTVSGAILGHRTYSRTAYAAMEIGGGGTVTDVMLNGGGNLYVRFGGTAVNTVINWNESIGAAGIMYVSSGGTATGTTVNRGGTLRINSGGTALGIRENGGCVEIDSRQKDSTTVVTFASNSFSGYVGDMGATVHSGTTANRAVLTGRTSMTVYSGGIASGVVNSGALVFISSGGYADSTTLKTFIRGASYIANASMFISSGGTADHTRVIGLFFPAYGYTGGILTVSRGGSANYTTVESGGCFTVLEGGTANFTTINGHRNPFSYGYGGGYGPDQDEQFCGSMTVSRKGIADNTMVNPGGFLNVAGTATNIIENGGYVSGIGKMTFASNTFSRIELGGYESATVHSGTTAVSVTLAGGRLEIFSGGKLTGRTIISGGGVYADQGAIVDFDLTQDTPGMKINDLSAIKGTPTYTITVSDTQAAGIYALAAKASNFNKTITVVNTLGESLGTLRVGETATIAGVAYNLVLEDKAYLYLMIGDESEFPTTAPYTWGGLVLYGKSSKAQCGESYHDTILLSGGRLDITSGVIADTTTVYSGGSLRILKGGTATNIIENGGYVECAEGAEVSFVSNVFYNSTLSGAVTLHSGTTACNAKITGATMFVYNGGLVNGVTGACPTRDDLSRLAINIFSGGIVNDAELINRRCTMSVGSGGMANRTKIVFSGIGDDYSDDFGGGGRMTVRHGTANSTIVGRGGWLELYGGTIDGTIISGGSVMMRVDEKNIVAQANNTIIDGGAMSVGTGGTVHGVTINNGGSLIFNGDEALDIVENGGFVSIYSGCTNASISFLSNTFSDLELSFSASGRSATIHSGTTAVSTTINQGGRLFLYEGGVASVMLVNSMGSVFVSGGTVNNVVINNRGVMRVSNGKNAPDGPVSATLNDVVVTKGGSLFITNSATVNGLTVLGGGIVSIPGTRGMTFSRTVLNYGAHLYLDNGAKATDTTLNHDASLDLSAGAEASSTTVNNGGHLTVDHGGMATGVAVENGGYLSVSGGTATGILASDGACLMLAVDWDTFVQGTSGGKAFEIADGNISGYSIDHGELTVCDGCTAADVTVQADATLCVMSGGTATGVVWTPCVGSVWIEDGGVVSFANQLSGVYYGVYGELVLHEQVVEALAMEAEGDMHVMSGGTANGTVVNEEGQMTVFSGGTANQTTVNGCGQMFVFSGGTANGTMVNEEGRMTVFSGGTANQATVNANGSVDISSGGGADSVAINGGSVVVSSGGIVVQTVLSDGMLTVCEGAAAEATAISSGELLVLEGGTVTGIDIGGGVLNVSSGGTATGIDIGGGVLNVSSGGTATGIEARQGAVFHFSLASNTLIQGTSNGSAFELKEDVPLSGFAVNGGSLEVYDGCTAAGTVVVGGTFTVYEGDATSTTVEGGVFTLYDGCTAAETIVSSGEFHASDGMATSTAINEGSFIVSGGTAVDTVVRNGMFELSLNGTATSTTMEGGSFAVSDATAISTIIDSAGSFALLLQGRAIDTDIRGNGAFTVSSGGTATNTVVSSGALTIIDGGTAANATVAVGGKLTVDSGAFITGRLTMEEGAVVEASDGFILNFDLTCTSAGADALVNDWSLIQGTPVCTLTPDTSLTKGVYMYALAEGITDFPGAITISVMDPLTINPVTLAVGETVTIDSWDYTLALTDSVLSLTVDVPVPPQSSDLSVSSGTATASMSWSETWTKEYFVEYSTDGFEHVIRTVTTTPGIDVQDLPAGTYQWRVKADVESEWAAGEAFVSETAAGAESGTPKVVQSNEDGYDDMFFASASGTWENLYYAQHAGSINDWTGTNDIVSARGRNRIQNLFFGSSDPNVLCLTDDENGDAIFVDDIYTELPEEIEENMARLYKIRKIRAGAGNDIVDMTSQRFEYTGDGLAIHGGDGDDTIWANKGDNFLFGDAGNDRIVGASGNDVIAGGIGNDRMHGGGGNDVFTFCGNWGADTVEQLVDGSVTLWFAEGSKDNWDEATLTYTDGENSVKVSGVTVEKVTLKFGDDESGQFAALSSAGAFLDVTSERIFEESGKGILASQ